MEKKIDKRISYKVVIDTETCPVDKDLKEVSPQNMFVYDCGWVVTDKRGRVYEERSFIVKEIFEQEKDLMKSAYYSNKIPMYLRDIAEGKRVVKTWFEIRQQLKKDCEDYGVKEVYAHNMRFDYGVANNTQRWLTKSKYRYFFPFGVEICDTLKMARQLVGTMPTYKRFCERNGFLTKDGRVRLTAEILYKFITGNLDFVESHTGLEDVKIEKEIMAYCFRKHKKFDRYLFNKAVA